MSNEFIDVTEYTFDKYESCSYPVMSAWIRMSDIVGIRLYKDEQFDMERTYIYIYTSHGSYSRIVYTLEDAQAEEKRLLGEGETR